MTPSAQAAVSPAPTRRARQRAATTGEIKALARRQLAEQGPGGLSLRAIARQMGTAPSALYRYFPSQSDLVTELCVEAYDSLAETLATARDAQPGGDHAGRWVAVCHAYRRWSLDHPADFALIFGTPLPGYHAPPEVTAAAAGRAIGVAADVYAAAVQAGAADPGRTEVPANLKTGALWAALAGDGSPGREPILAGIVLTAWASLLGYLVTEIFGSLTALISDSDTLYEAHVRTVTLGMGFQPALIEPTAPGQR
jgi:AcrR family transcriptional regulator